MLTRWNNIDRTWTMLDELRQRMDSVFTDYERGGLPTARESWPRVNVYDAETKLIFEALLPGVKSEQLDVTATRDTLVISGERQSAVPEGYSVHRRERGNFKFSRSFALRDTVDPEKVKASLKDGILTVTLEKAPEARPRRIALSE